MENEEHRNSSPSSNFVHCRTKTPPTSKPTMKIRRSSVRRKLKSHQRPINPHNEIKEQKLPNKTSMHQPKAILSAKAPSLLTSKTTTPSALQSTCRSIFQLAQQFGHTLLIVPASSTPQFDYTSNLSTKAPVHTTSNYKAVVFAKKVTQPSKTTINDVHLDAFVSPREVASAAKQLLDFELKLMSNKPVNQYSTAELNKIFYFILCVMYDGHL